ncbi:MAG: 50S ribosomal protein L11 methyltransferase [Bacteroidales bacterium]|jgi:ribosomal protein L11 methyltransferase|nr:50S ribosomal protein L11 methyltransferase [Bacteroidales bacterium]
MPPKLAPKTTDMQYIELKMQVDKPAIGNEILIAFLATLGFESFVENEEGFLAYIPKNDFQNTDFQEFINNFKSADFQFTFELNEIKNQNWNAVWESNYESVIIDNQCYIRAPFHASRPDLLYEILIEPKMSFGTAHHPTTALIISYLLKENLTAQKVLDMGTGTGILAILAKMRGANSVLAIDNDQNAYENCLENVQRNQCSDIEVVMGDAKAIKNGDYDVIIANINRNIILNDLPAYAKALKNGGRMFLSGFYKEPDLELITNHAAKYELFLDSFMEKENWVAAKLIKNS